MMTKLTKSQRTEMEMLCMMVTFRLEAGIHAHKKVTTTGVNLTWLYTYSLQIYLQ